jgi:hypothetical protein
MKKSIVAVALLTTAGQALAYSDTFMRAVTFALTGRDGQNVEVADPKDCVFQIHENKSHDSEQYVTTTTFYLNRVDPSRITIQNMTQTLMGQTTPFIYLDLYGETVVYEYTDPKFTSAYPSKLIRDADGNIQFNVVGETHATLRFDISESARYARAWKYIYANGCTGTRGSF